MPVIIWTLVTTPAGGGCCPAAPGRTRRGARPSAAAAARACPCTCPCRRACWSPRSTTRWRGAASATTASTCRDVPSPPATCSVGGSSGARTGKMEKGAKHPPRALPGRPWHACSLRPPRRPTYVLAVPGRAPPLCTYMAATDMGVMDWRQGRTWWATVAGPGRRPACAAVHGAWTRCCCALECGRGAAEPAAPWTGPATRRWRRQGKQLPQAISLGMIFFASFLRKHLA